MPKNTESKNSDFIESKQESRYQSKNSQNFSPKKLFKRANSRKNRESQADDQNISPETVLNNIEEANIQCKLKLFSYINSEFILYYLLY